MTDYTPYTPAEYAPDAPATSEHFRRWFENWIAGFEGAVGAPRQAAKAHANPLLGRLTVTGTAGQGFTGLDGVSLVRADYAINSLAGTPTLRARYSADGGGAWGSWQNLSALIANSVYSGAIRLDLKTGAWSMLGLGVDIGASGLSTLFGAGTHTVPANCNAFQLSWSAVSRSLYGDFYILAGV